MTADSKSSSCDNVLTESILENLENTFDIADAQVTTKVVDPSTTSTESEIQCPNDNNNSSLTALDNTLHDPDFTLSSTFSPSELDGTYDANVSGTLDTSITELKRAVQTEDKINQKTKDNRNKSKEKEKNVPNSTSSDDDIPCIESCKNDSNSASIRCNLCLTWCHTLCVGIKDLDDVDAWVCADCKELPKTVKYLKSQVETLVQTTSNIFRTFEAFSKNMEHKFENLNDRLTGLSNQNKKSNETCTSSLIDINTDINTLRSEMDKKSNAILSKSQSMLDQIKVQPDPVRNEIIVQPNQKSNQKSNQANHKSQNEKRKPENNKAKENSSPIVIDLDPEFDPVSPTPAQNNSHDTETAHVTGNQSDVEPTSRKTQKRDLTFLTGSCILQYIQTRHLNNNVRVKSFKGAKIDDLKTEMTKMDLSRYQNLILHVGGHDIDANISQTAFKEKYSALLNSVNNNSRKVFVSGLLPRRGINVKPFNSILKDLCRSVQAEFVDNHDSFVMASGEIPFDFFFPDKVNLKFSETRKLVQNINKSCSILPKQHCGRVRDQNGHRAQLSNRSDSQKKFQGHSRRLTYRN